MATNAIIQRRTTCRLCLSSDTSCVLSLSPTPVGEGYVPAELLGVSQETFPVDLLLCQSCGHAQLADIIDPAELYRHYIYKTAHSLGLVQHFERYAEAILQAWRPDPGTLVVDVGSNDGSLLRAFKNRGMKVAGVDPATKIAAEATASGVPTFPDFFTPELAATIRREHGAPSLITMNNAFANIDDLHAIVQGVKNLLRPDGVFVFETGYLLDVVQKLIFDNIYHEHLSYFAVAPVKSFLAANGLELLDVVHVPTKGGSIRCAAQLQGGPRKVSASVEGHIRVERDTDLFDVRTYRALESRIRVMKEQTHDRIRSLKSKGNSVAGYGASVTVTGILYNFGLDRSLIDYLVDDNPVRHGLYSPGFHIPVYPSDRLTTTPPSYVVVLAWQYAAPILSRHPRYLANGGHFLLFQPYLQVLHRGNVESPAPPRS